MPGTHELERAIGQPTVAPEGPRLEEASGYLEGATAADAQRAVGRLKTVRLLGIPIQMGNVTLGPDQLQSLIDSFPGPEAVLENWATGRLRRRGLAWLVGGRLLRLKDDEGNPLFPKKTVRVAAESLLRQLPLLARTPREYIPQKASETEILSPSLLEDTMEIVALSEDPDSVANQLLRPITLNSNGLVITVAREQALDSDQDFTLPQYLLTILGTLKYQESEKVLTDWLLVKLSSQYQTDSIRFIEALTNFTAFLDSATYLKLFQPAKVPDRQKEILLQPFRGLLNSITKAADYLRRADPQMRYIGPLVEKLQTIQTLVEMRYFEVYGGLYHTSLYTVSPEALTPRPETFAKFVHTLLKLHPEDGLSPQEVATAVVKLAELMGVSDLAPLTRSLETQPFLQEAVVEAGQKYGLIPDSQAVQKAVNLLRRQRWADAAETNLANIIHENATDLEIYVVTGTFRPFTKGHRDLIEKLIAYMNFLDRTTRWDAERTTQRIILIAPVTEISRIPQYQKSAAQSGPLEAGVGSMLLQLAGDINPREVFITTTLQPEPTKVSNLTQRVFHTIAALNAKILKDMERAGRAYGLKVKPIFVHGPDEIQWQGEPRQIDKNQPRKVKDPSLVIGRHGWLVELVEHRDQLTLRTGTVAVILTPGTPYTSSTAVIQEIAQTGRTKAVLAGAQDYVCRQWGTEAMTEWAKQVQDIPTNKLPQSIGTICRNLISEARPISP